MQQEHNVEAGKFQSTINFKTQLPSLGVRDTGAGDTEAQNVTVHMFEQSH